MDEEQILLQYHYQSERRRVFLALSCVIFTHGAHEPTDNSNHACISRTNIRNCIGLPSWSAFIANSIASIEQSPGQVWCSSAELIFEEWLGPLVPRLIISIVLAPLIIGAQRGLLTPREQCATQQCEHYTSNRHHRTPSYTLIKMLQTLHKTSSLESAYMSIAHTTLSKKTVYRQSRRHTVLERGENSVSLTHS